jgi:hypothetical protein
MARGDIKAGNSAIIGAAGEYFVMAELLKRGRLAGLAPRGTRDFDIIATKSGSTIHVRVKTKTADSKLFRWNRRLDDRVFRVPLSEKDFCVLVDIGGESPTYFVIPTELVEGKLQQNWDEWRRGKAPEVGRTASSHFDWAATTSGCLNSRAGKFCRVELSERALRQQMLDARGAGVSSLILIKPRRPQAAR